MSNLTKANNSYALNQPINLDAPYPIVARRAPTTADKAPIGQQWVVPSANAVYFLSSVVNNAANWVAVAGAAGSFTSLTVTPGPTNLTGALTVIAGTNNINIGADAAIHDVNIGSQTGTSLTSIFGGTGGIALTSANATVFVSAAPFTVASPTATIATTGRVNRVVFTGFTTANGASQIFTITNANLDTDVAVLVTADNGGANDAQMTIYRVEKDAGSIDITLRNNGAAALNGDVTINLWILN